MDNPETLIHILHSFFHRKDWGICRIIRVFSNSIKNLHSLFKDCGDLSGLQNQRRTLAENTRL